MKKIFWGGLLALFASATVASARPLLTEQVEPVGYLNFEGGIHTSYREDKFNDPELTYKTVNIPATIRFGIRSTTEIGLNFNYISQSLETTDGKLKGSLNSDLSLETKYSPWDSLGIQAFWHVHHNEDSNAELPIAHGDDFELIGLIKVPFPIGKVHLNGGYLFREPYHSSLGIRNTDKLRVEPGDIFEARASWEIPILWHFNLLTEYAYYKFGEEKIQDVPIEDSKGTAQDALVGLTWDYGNWNLGTGIAFGLGAEDHTSFNLTRGAGDWNTHLSLAYKITPRSFKR